MSQVPSSLKSRGQALAEFALVAPVLFLMFFGIIEFGRFVLAYEELNNATREGARYAIVNGSASLCPSGPMPGGAVSPSSCADPTGAQVQRQVQQYGLTTTLTAPTVAVPAPPDCLTPSTNEVTVCWDDTDNGRGHSVTVQASYLFHTIIPLPLPPITMTARTTLVINN